MTLQGFSVKHVIQIQSSVAEDSGSLNHLIIQVSYQTTTRSAAHMTCSRAG